MGDPAKPNDLTEANVCNDKTAASNAAHCLRAELPGPPIVKTPSGETPASAKDGLSDYAEAITKQHQAKLKADEGSWNGASTLYQEAITEADKIDRQTIGTQLTHVRAELKTENNPKKKNDLTAEVQKLYSLYQAPVSTRTNYALACYRYGFVQEGDKAWNDAVKLDISQDLKQHPDFVNQITAFRGTVVQREEAVGTTMNLLQKANDDLTAGGQMNSSVQQQYEQAINAAETAESKLDLPLLKTELMNSQNQLVSLGLDNKLADFKAKIIAFEAALPTDQRAKLADIDGAIATLQEKQEDQSAKGQVPLASKIIQSNSNDFDKKLFELQNQRVAVYQLPPNLAADRDLLNQQLDTAKSLQQTMDHDYTLLHLPALVRASYAEALDDSGQHDTAVQQRQNIAAIDKEFYDNALNAVTNVDAIAGASSMAKALDLVANNNGYLTPEARLLFDQARTSADAQLNKDRTQLEGQIHADQGELTSLNQAKLAHYNQLLLEWKTNNPDGKNWDALSAQITNQKEQLNKLGVAPAQHESLQQTLDTLVQKRDELLPDYLTHAQTFLAPELQRVAQLQGEIDSLQKKLNIETRMSAMARVYEAVALKRSGDPTQIQEAEGLLKDVVYMVGANPQDIAQAAADVLHSNGMNQAEPIFKAAVEMADLARNQQLADATQLISSSTGGYLADSSQLVSQDMIASHPEAFSTDPRQGIIADAPVQNRWLYAVSLFNSGQKQEGVQLLEQLRQQTSDTRTIASLDVAKGPNTSTITPELLKAAAEKLMQNEVYLQQAAGAVDMLTTVVAARFGAGPYAPVLGSAAGTAALTTMDYAFYGRTPTGAQIAVYASLGWGIGATSGLAESLVTSQAARLIAPRALANANTIISRYAPDSLTGLSDLSILPRLEATSGVLKNLYRAERSNISIEQFLFGRGVPRSYNEILNARVSVQRANRFINALGFGAAAITPVVVVQGVSKAATGLDSSIR